MTRGFLSKAACLALAASVGACASNRFEGPRERPRPQAALEPATPALPAGTVTSEPLAPPPGASAAPGEPPPPSVAAAPSPALEPPPPPAPPPVVATGRSAVVGSWNATDAAGSCKVSLSSTPSLDLYKATTAGCGNKDRSDRTERRHGRRRPGPERPASPQRTASNQAHRTRRSVLERKKNMQAPAPFGTNVQGTLPTARMTASRP